MIGFILPLCIAFLNEFSIRRDEWPLRIKNSIIALLVSYIVMGIAHVTLSDSVTVYEITLIGGIATVFADLLLLPIIQKRPDLKHIILKTVCILCVLVAGYSILTYGQTLIHSDTATATILAQSIMKHRSLFPATWAYGNGDIWVLSIQLFVLLPSLLIKNQSLARMVGSLFFVLVSMCGVVYQSKKMFRNNSWTLSIPLLLLFIFTPGTNTTGDCILYQAAYTGQILWIAICGMLLSEIYRTYGNPSKKYLAIYGILMILLCMSGPRMMAEQAIPALCACIVMIYAGIRTSEEIDWKNTLKKTGYLCGAVLIPSIIGFGIYKWLCSWHNVNPSREGSTIYTSALSNIWDNTVSTILAFFECFGFSGNAELLSIQGIRNMISIMMCIILCLLVPILQWKKIKQEREEIQLFLAFGVVHNLIMIILAILFDKIRPRYLLTAVFVFTIISARYIYAYWIDQTNFRKYVWTGLFSFAAIIECISLASYSSGWEDNLIYQKSFTDELIARGYTKGYATYWYAYNHEIYSDLQIRFGGVTIDGDNINQTHWLVDSDVFDWEDKETFLLLTQSENERIGSSLTDICGEPTESFWLHGVCIYVYDHDIGEDFNNGLLDDILTPRELTLSGAATANYDELYIPAGGGFYGPYATMKAGEYTVTYYGDNFDICDYDIYSNEDADSFTYDEVERTNDSITIELSVFSQIEDIEFRMFNNTEADTAYLYEITVDSND